MTWRKKNPPCLSCLQVQAEEDMLVNCDMLLKRWSILLLWYIPNWIDEASSPFGPGFSLKQSGVTFTLKPGPGTHQLEAHSSDAVERGGGLLCRGWDIRCGWTGEGRAGQDGTWWERTMTSVVSEMRIWFICSVTSSRREEEEAEEVCVCVYSQELHYGLKCANVCDWKWLPTIRWRH